MGLKVAVLMGGTSHERAVSLSSGKQVCKALEEVGYEVVPLDTTADLVDVLEQDKPDVVYSALHGKHGEDGAIQSILELMGIPFVGSPSKVCRLSFDKAAISKVLSDPFSTNDLSSAHTPHKICMNQDAFTLMGAGKALKYLDQILNYPLAVKPNKQGSAYGVSKVNTFDELGQAILHAFSYDDEILFEEWVDGAELAISVVASGEDAFCLPAVEIVPKEGKLYDFEARMDRNSIDYYAPCRLESLSSSREDAEAIYAELERAALQVYKAYGCRDLARIDMIWDGGKAQVLEIEVSPGMTDLSLFPMAVSASNETLGEILASLIDQAIAR